MDDTGPAPGTNCTLTILMPCLDEARTVGRCIDKARGFLDRAGIDGEIVIADNGSADGSQAIAREHGARVVAVAQRGYGAALIAGIAASHGRWVIMGDADDSYDFSNLLAFVAALHEGADLVMGNRFKGGIKPGAMPPLHRYLGNPVLSTIGRIFFHAPCSDFHCGLRGFRRDAILALDLQAQGMEFASEMVVKASLAGLRITEVPTTLSPDGRDRPPHLRSWRDGWRHLRFLLLYCPRWLFLYPGIGLFVAGLGGMAWLLPQPRPIEGVTFDIHTLYYCSLGVVIGFQAIAFWIFAKVYGERERIVPPDPVFHSLVRLVPLEIGLVAAVVLLLLGFGLGAYALSAWGAERFGPLDPTETMRLIIPSGTAILLGLQLGLGSFFVSLLEVRGAVAAAAIVSRPAAPPRRAAVPAIAGAVETSTENRQARPAGR